MALNADPNFPRRLSALLAHRKMTPSDLAREVWGSTTTTTGHSAARNRDRISAYLTGRSEPKLENLTKMAAALGVKAQDLLPSAGVPVVDRDNPELSMTTIAGRPDMVHLKLDKTLPLDVASVVIAAISASEKARGNG